MSSVIYKNVNSTPILAVGGGGVWLEDTSGNRFLDTCGGVAVSSLGHRHPRVGAAIERSARDLAWVHAGSFTTAAAEELAGLLAGWSGGLTRVQCLSGGSEAMELALKIAYQYHCESGNPGKQAFVARRQNYHGSTLSMLAISGNRQRRSVFEPLLPPVEFVSPCYAYRDQEAGESDDEYGRRLAAELEEAILRIGPENVAGFVAETVVGSTSGAVPPVPGYFQHIAEVCRRRGVLLILDEVMAGMGRTGREFAYLDDGVLPDIAAVGKGLAAGYQPISAVLVAPHIHDALADGTGVLQNGQTHVNHPLACAIALEVQRTIAEEDLLANVRVRGEQLRALLGERFADNEFVDDVRGRGLFCGIEFVADRSTREPLPDGAAVAAAMKKQGLADGLLLYPGYGTIDGLRGNHLLLAPPFIVTESHLEEMVERLSVVVDACLPSVVRMAM
ncbi:MAG: aspartate aminotransferase family protein [Pseudonocardiaceae bacterium]